MKWILADGDDEVGDGMLKIEVVIVIIIEVVLELDYVRVIPCQQDGSAIAVVV